MGGHRWNKMLSYHDLHGKILGKILEVNGFKEHYKSCWSEIMCSIMADGRTWMEGNEY